MLRKKGVVGKFVEFYGPGLDYLAGRPGDNCKYGTEYGATCGFFPIDQDTVGYLKATGRGKACADLVEQYAKAQGMYRTKRSPDPVFTSTLSLDLGDVRPPRRAQTPARPRAA